MITRRDYLKNSALIAAIAALPSGLLAALERGALIEGTIPRTGEKVPIVGLGTAASFRSMSRADDTSALREVIRMLVDNGGTVLDTAPSYAESEAVCGDIARDLSVTDKIFWATKVNDAPRGRPKADPERALAQLNTSFERIRKQPVDLIQVHNLGDLPTQMPIIEELKQDGKIRYIGTTTTRTSEYGRLEQAMRAYPLDFIGIDYSVEQRVAAERVLPLAEELGIAVLGYEPFGDSLFTRVRGLELPDWARAIGMESWAQFFLKFAAGHSAITCVTPATSKPKHMLDNIGAAYGELPDKAIQGKMAAFIDALPQA